MKRYLAALFLLISVPVLGQVGIPPGVINVITAPSGPCQQGVPGQKDNTGAITTCQGPFVAGVGTWASSISASLPVSAVEIGSDSNGTAKAISAWQRQGIAISPIPTDPSQQVQESSAILDSSPEILSGSTYSQVVKHLFTCGWWPLSLGGAGMNICFAESPDGLTNMTRYSGNPLITNHARSFLMPAKVGSNYVLYATNMIAVPPSVDIYTGTTIAGLTLAHSAVLACGSNGQETNHSIGMAPFIISGSHWGAFYDCQMADNQYVVYLANSVDAGVTWTKVSTLPVIGETSPITCGGLCYEGGGEWAEIINGTLHVYGHYGPNSGVAGLPTPYIWHFTDTSATPGQHLVADAAPAMQAQTTAEGANTKAGQFADPYLLDMGGLNKSILYVTSYTNGCSGSVTCALPAFVTGNTMNQPLANAVTGTQIDNSQSVGAPLIQVNGTSVSRRDVVNLQGPGVTDLGNGTVSVNLINSVTGILGSASTSPVVAADNFVRNAGALGANWTGSANITITASGLVGDLAGATNDNAWFTGTAFTADQCSYFTVGALPVNGGWIAASVRSSASTGYAMLVFYHSGTSPSTALYKFSGTWTGTLLGTQSPGGTAMIVGDVFGLCVVGTTLTGYRNGFPMSTVTTTDATFAGPGSAGIGMNSANTTARISNFQGNNVGATPSVTVTMGGSALTIGCGHGTASTATATVQLADTTMHCAISGAAGNPVDVIPECSVTAANTVSATLCAYASTTPASQTYNIRVIP